MANYAVDEEILQEFLPRKTEIDFREDTCYVSLVGFMFQNTTVKGLKIPFHVNFEEVNLRFYVLHRDALQWKRGVVFVKEIVPKPLLTFVANTRYREHYETMPMKHNWQVSADTLSVEYQWRKEKWNSFKVSASAEARTIAADSEEEFITQHFWGYTRIDDRSTAEYEVEHPRWRVHDVTDYAINVDFGSIYGKEFDFLNRETPKSVFLAEGSEVIVREGIRI